jgi:hypothetical protein
MPELDAGCDGRRMIDVIPDEHTRWLVLFASVLYRSPGEILERAREWRELFGGG